MKHYKELVKTFMSSSYYSAFLLIGFLDKSKIRINESNVNPNSDAVEKSSIWILFCREDIQHQY